MSSKKCHIIRVHHVRPGYKDYRELFESALLLETSPADAVGGGSVGEIDLLSVYYFNRSTVWIKPGYAHELYRGDGLDL